MSIPRKSSSTPAPAEGRDPFVMIPLSLLRAPRVSLTAKLVLPLLEDHWNRKTGQCNPGIDTLAKELAVSDRTIDRSITELSRLGLIKITWKQRTSHYDVAPRTRWAGILKRQIGVSEKSCNDKLASQLRQIGVSDGPVPLYEPDLENQSKHTPYPRGAVRAEAGSQNRRLRGWRRAWRARSNFSARCGLAERRRARPV